MWAVLAATGTMLGIVLAWLPARGLFRFGPLHADDLAITFAAGVAVLIVLEVPKRLWRGRLLSG